MHEGDLGEGMAVADAGGPSNDSAFCFGSQNGIAPLTPTVRPGFRYTNGLFGDKGGKKPWLKCESDCKGTGYGGYGFCYTKGMGRPWGGCMAPGDLEKATHTLYHTSYIFTDVAAFIR